MIKKFGTANWKGKIKEGGGTISTETAALKDQPYGFNARFEGGKGTNPEELVGAAHAACFAMALSLNLTENDFEAENIDAKSTLSLEKDSAGGGFKVSKAHIEVTATVPGISAEKFMELAKATKEGCPISKLLNAEISMDAKLV
jgi:osmotically inducible protein OsmC